MNWKQEVCLGSGMMSLETLQPKEEKNEIWTLRDEESVGQCGRGREDGSRAGGGYQRPRKAGYQATSDALLHKGPGKESGWLILGGAVLGLVPALLLKTSEGWEPSSHKWTLGTALGKTDTASLY